MSKFIVRRKSSESAEDTPLADALSRLSSPGYGAFARVMLEDSNFTPFSEISVDSDSSQTLRSRKTIIVDGEQRAMQRLSEETTQQYYVERLIEHSKAEVPFDMFRAAPLDLTEMLRAKPLSLSAVGAERKLTIQVRGRGARRYENLAHAEVHVFLAASGMQRGHLQVRTDADGVA